MPLAQSDPHEPARLCLTAGPNGRSAEKRAAVHEAGTNGSFAWFVHVFAKSVSCCRALGFASDEQVFGKSRDITLSAGLEEGSATMVVIQKSWLVFRKLLFEEFAEVLCL